MDSIEVEMSDHENVDNNTNKAQIVEPTSGTETHKTDHELILVSR
jgi:hypothetical protein